MTDDLADILAPPADAFPCVIRPMSADDRSFAYAAWLKDFLANADATTTRFLGNHMGGQWRRVIEDLLNRRTVLIACAPQDRDTVLGFVCGDPGARVVDYVLVKESFRGHGLARRLLRTLIDNPVRGFEYTHRTASVTRFLSAHDWPLQFNFTRLFL
jgi:GNAT superfamily N-acetyltransferase